MGQHSTSSGLPNAVTPVSPTAHEEGRDLPLADSHRAHPLDVLVLTAHPQGTVPGQRFRFEQQREALADRGIRLNVSSFLSADMSSRVYRPGGYAFKVGAFLHGTGTRIRDLLSARDYDVALVHKGATPLGYPFVERLLASFGIPYVFDFDDAIYLPLISEANRIVAPLKFARRAEVIARHADLIVTGNRYLADWAERHNRNVRVIPTTIDMRIYRSLAPREPGDRPVCVGWSGSSHNVRHLNLLAPVLRDLQKEAGIMIKVIGDPDYRIAGAEVRATRWQEATEIADLTDIDIGVMPLPDDEWARGKCGLKALQYMALGIPTVMSPVGVNTEIARDHAALLASTDYEWRAALRKLIADPALRRELGERGRRRVESEYSADVAAPLWADALRSVVRTVPRSGT